MNGMRAPVAGGGFTMSGSISNGGAMISRWSAIGIASAAAMADAVVLDKPGEAAFAVP